MPNDQLDEINREPRHFAEQLTGAVNMSCVQREPTHLRGRFYDFTVPYCSHADDVGLVAVGGNCATTIMKTHGGYTLNHTIEEGQVELLKRLADSLGYTVRKRKK